VTATATAVAEGYAVPAAGESLARRAWRTRGWWALLGMFLAIVVLQLLPKTASDKDPLSTRNAEPQGAMATAEVLRDRGVEVRQIAHLGDARISDPASTTLAIVLPSALASYQVDSVLRYPGDIVFIGVSGDVLTAVDPTLQRVDAGQPTLRAANCHDADAVAAERIESGGAQMTAPGIPFCFADAEGAGPYVTLYAGDNTITLLSDATLPMNAHLTEYGNAALTFRALGKHENLVWYLGNPADVSTLTYTSADGSGSVGGPGGPSEAPSGDLLPPGTGTAMYALALAVVVAAIWRGRRMGRLVTDHLPVVIPSSETTRGRARLYRRARAYGRATASLRAASAERMGKLLGVPRSAGAPLLIAAVARASGRDPLGVERLLYGPPPDSERAMMVLVQELDTLERQVHRP